MRAFFSAGAFIRKKAVRLIVPYLFFCLVSILVWRLFGTDSWSHLLAIIAWGGAGVARLKNNPLWFLNSLFCSYCLFAFLQRITRDRLQFVVGCVFFLLFGFLLGAFHVKNLPWALDSGLVGVFFVGMGCLCRDLEIYRKITQYLGRYPLLTILLFGVVCILAKYHDRTMMMGNAYAPWYVFLICSAGGIIGVWGVSVRIGSNAVLEYLGRNSLVLFCLNYPAQHGLYALGKVLNGDSELSCILWVIMQFLVLFPVVFALTKLFPFIIGNNPRKLGFEPMAQNEL